MQWQHRHTMQICWLCLFFRSYSGTGRNNLCLMMCFRYDFESNATTVSWNFLILKPWLTLWRISKKWLSNRWIKFPHRIRCTYFVHKHRNFHVTFHFISLYATRTANKLFALLEFCDKVAKKARGKSRAPDFRAINIWIFCQPTSQHVIREMKRRGNKNGKRCV